jgi:glucose-6-phosphate isomerase
MHFEQTSDHCLALIPAKDKAGFAAVLKRAGQEAQKLLRQADAGKCSIFSHAAQQADLKEIKQTGNAILKRFKHLVVLGTGGSTLCGQALVGASTACRFSLKGDKTQLHFLDNIDPHTTALALEQLPLEDTCFLVVSKSGATLETVTQFLLFYGAYQKRKIKDAQKHFLFITDPAPNILRKTAASLGIKVLDHAASIGGRFSILTNVGLLPAYIAGLDIETLRKAAGASVKACLKPGSAACVGAALQYYFMQSGHSVTVYMPYQDQLRPFAYWLRQIWSESLGKNGKGSTPLNATGTLDQHSLLQQFLDGPNDKFYTLFSPVSGPRSKELAVDTSCLKGNDFTFIEGLPLSKVMEAQYTATLQTLKDKKRPVRSLTIGTLNEAVLGELCIQFITETILMSKLMGINAFDQPAVEQGKVLAKKLLEKVA